MDLQPTQPITTAEAEQNNYLIRQIMRNRRAAMPWGRVPMALVEEDAPSMYPTGMVGDILHRVHYERLLMIKFPFPIWRDGRRVTDGRNRALVPEWLCKPIYTKDWKRK